MSPASDRPPGPLVSPYRAVLRRLILVIAITFLGAAAGAAMGLKRQPVYQSETVLTVGRATTSAQSVPGYALALESLAGSYSRIATSQKVAAQTAANLGVPVEQVMGVVEASQVPASSLIIVRAYGSEPGRTIETANASAQSLIEYVSASEVSSGTILKRYEAAQRALARSTARLERLEREEVTGDELIDAQAQQAADRLRSTSLEAAYPQAQSSKGRKAVEVLTPATAASDDRRSKLQISLATGLILGLAIAVGLATLLENRPRRTRPSEA